MTTTKLALFSSCGPAIHATSVAYFYPSRNAKSIYCKQEENLRIVIALGVRYIINPNCLVCFLRIYIFVFV
jgi:hypothetical protein